MRATEVQLFKVLLKEGQIPAISARVCAVTQDHSGAFKILLKFIFLHNTLFPRNFTCYRLIKRINLKVFKNYFSRSLKLPSTKFCESSVYTT
jgi:hypothetical protein